MSWVWLGVSGLVYILAGKAGANYDSGSRFQHAEKLQFAKVLYVALLALFLCFNLHSD